MSPYRLLAEVRQDLRAIQQYYLDQASPTQPEWFWPRCAGRSDFSRNVP